MVAHPLPGFARHSDRPRTEGSGTGGPTWKQTRSPINRANEPAASSSGDKPIMFH
jgi:hypothetical protein